jgi:hypothetical protein
MVDGRQKWARLIWALWRGCEDAGARDFSLACGRAVSGGREGWDGTGPSMWTPASRLPWLC